MNPTAERVPDAAVAEKSCKQCQRTFLPNRPSQAFCGSACRVAFHKDHGTTGVVDKVRRIKTGVSITVHLPEACADAALKFRLRDLVRLVAEK